MRNLVFVLPLLLAQLTQQQATNPLLWNLGGHAFASQQDLSANSAVNDEEQAGQGYLPSPTTAGDSAGYNGVRGAYNPADRNRFNAGQDPSWSPGNRGDYNYNAIQDPSLADEQFNQYNAIAGSDYPAGIKARKASYKAAQATGYNPAKPQTWAGQASYNNAIQDSSNNPAGVSSTGQPGYYPGQGTGYNPSDTSSQGAYAGYYGSTGAPGYSADQGYGAAGTGAADGSSTFPWTSSQTSGQNGVTGNRYGSNPGASAGLSAGGQAGQAGQAGADGAGTIGWYQDSTGNWVYGQQPTQSPAAGSTWGSAATAGTADQPAPGYLGQDQNPWGQSWGQGGWGQGGWSQGTASPTQETTTAAAEQTGSSSEEEEETAPSAESTTTAMPETTTQEVTEAPEEEESGPSSSQSSRGPVRGTYTGHPGSTGMRWRYGEYQGHSPLPGGFGAAQAGGVLPGAGFDPAQAQLTYLLAGGSKGGDDDEGGKGGSIVPIFGTFGYPGWGIVTGGGKGGDD